MKPNVLNAQLDPTSVMVVAFFAQHLIKIVQPAQTHQHAPLVFLLPTIQVDNNASNVLTLSVTANSVQVDKIAQNAQQDST